MRSAILRSLAESSAALIAECQHSSGAYPACPTYEVYGFSWFRDGSFIADAMSRAGRPESADAFLGWCARVVTARSALIGQAIERSERGDVVTNDDLLPTRYILDGGDDPSPWWNFQLDGYGTWLWVLAAHVRRHGYSGMIANGSPYRSAVNSTVDYLVSFGLRPCYDWWEEHVEQRHTSTLGAIAAGLSAAISLTDEDGSPILDQERTRRAGTTRDQIVALITTDGTRDGHLTKWLGSAAVDGSLLSCAVPLRIVEPGSPIAEQTYREVLGQLTPGGVYRYLGDTFYGGGEWLILTCWLGWYEARTGRHDEAMSRLEWVAGHATTEGWLPEQISTNAQQPGYIAEWTSRWGSVATPLLWSHAMYLTLATECGVWPAQDHTNVTGTVEEVTKGESSC